MKVPEQVNRAHVLAAMKRLGVEGVPRGGQSTRFDVLHPDGTRFPPKVVLAYALEAATGAPVNRRSFHGGGATNEPLRELGFEVDHKPGYVPPPRIEEIEPGRVLSNQELTDCYEFANAGGMRWSGEKQRLVVIADHTKSLYQDRWLGDTFHYTGMGRRGDQKLTGQNGRVARQRETGEIVDLYEVHEKNRYEYAGSVSLSGDPYQEDQIDLDGNRRRVWVFPLQLGEGGKRSVPSDNQLQKIQRKRRKRLLSKTLEELRLLAQTGGQKNPGNRTATTTHIERSAAVVEYVKAAADGQCDLCGKPAPFKGPNGPYLECHHIKHLAKDGDDVISNAVALCPNCHRRMHIRNEKGDLEKLRDRVLRREC